MPERQLVPLMTTTQNRSHIQSSANSDINGDDITEQNIEMRVVK